MENGRVFARFRPSGQSAARHVMLGVNVFAAETDAQAQLLFSSLQQAFVNRHTGRPGKLPLPVDEYEAQLPPAARDMLAHTLACSVVGSTQTVRDGLQRLIGRHAPDELMVTAQIFDHAARPHSFEIVADAQNSNR